MGKAETSLLGRLRRDRAGNVLMMAAAGMPLLIGAAGLAVDTVHWTYWKRQLQREADSAALAGAFAKAQSGNAITAATNDITRTTDVTLSAPATIQNAPTSGAYAGNSQAVRVSLSTRQRLPFSGSFLSAVPTITVTATAAVVSNGTYCALALGTGSNGVITMSGSASLNFGCGLATNSKVGVAVVPGGSADISATPIAAVGGLASSSHYASGTQLLPYSLPQPDPFASLPNPVVPSGSCPKGNYGPKDNVTIPSGSCFNGLKIQGTVKLEDNGVFYIDGGTLDINSTATLTGKNVTIILTSSTAANNPASIADLDIAGGATVQLSAPTSGPYKGLIFYQDRRALDSGSNTISGNATSTYDGGFYFPSQELDFTGNSGMTTNCMQLVALRLTFIGNTTVANTCDKTTDGGEAFKGVQVRLVE